jgi:hypothetical protein
MELRCRKCHYNKNRLEICGPRAGKGQRKNQSDTLSTERIFNFKNIYPRCVVDNYNHETSSKKQYFYSVIISTIYFGLKSHHQVEHKNKRNVHTVFEISIPYKLCTRLVYSCVQPDDLLCWSNNVTKIVVSTRFIVILIEKNSNSHTQQNGREGNDNTCDRFPVFLSTTPWRYTLYRRQLETPVSKLRRKEKCLPLLKIQPRLTGSQVGMPIKLYRSPHPPPFF